MQASPQPEAGEAEEKQAGDCAIGEDDPRRAGADGHVQAGKVEHEIRFAESDLGLQVADPVFGAQCPCRLIGRNNPLFRLGQGLPGPDNLPCRFALDLQLLGREIVFSGEPGEQLLGLERHGVEPQDHGAFAFVEQGKLERGAMIQRKAGYGKKQE